MGNYDGIEKYVNEHGSSTILGEFIGLINDKYKALEEKLLEAEARAERAEAARQKFEIEVLILRDRLRELEEKVEGGSRSTGMGPLEENILQLLAKRPDLETEAVAAVLRISPELAASHLKELENQKFAYGSYDYAMSAPTTWFLLQDGRNYLAAQGLI